MSHPWRVVSLLCAVTCVGYLVRGWIGTLAFWSAACVIAALLWLTVQVGSERAVC